MSVIFEESPVGDSQPNGLAEMAVREVKGIARSLKFFAEELHGITFAPSRPMLTWIVMHGAAVWSRAQRRPDGKMAWERCKGPPYRKPCPRSVRKSCTSKPEKRLVAMMFVFRKDSS